MTALRKDAMNLLEQMPEDKQTERERAFEELESLRKKAASLDYDKELESYKEEKYETANIS